MVSPRLGGGAPGSEGRVNDMYRMLEGMRVVEGSAFVAAPLGGMTLAQLGADVIRFDPIGGGLDARRWPLTREGRSLYWAGLNKGKRSIAVDLRQPEGRELVAALVTAPGEDGGIFLTNLPLRGPLAYESLRSAREDVIVLAIKGHHDGGIALDYTVNCAVGIPFATGHATRDAPVNHMLPAWDVAAGLTASTGLLAAERHRRRTGEGQLVSLALSDVAYAAVGNLGHIGEAEINRTERSAGGNHLYGAYGRDFATRDGRRIMVVAMTRRQWRSLCEATECADAVAALERELGVDLDEEGERFRARQRIDPLIARWVAAHDLEEVGKTFDAAGVCWGPYRSFLEMVGEDPRCSEANPLFQRVHQPGIGAYLMPGSPLGLGACHREPVRPAPELGAHTDEVLAEVLGLASVEIARLHDRGIVAGK